MIKHRYELSGIICEGCKFIKGEAIADDIVKAINYFRNYGYSVHSVIRKEQVPAYYSEGVLSYGTIKIKVIENKL